MKSMWIFIVQGMKRRRFPCQISMSIPRIKSLIFFQGFARLAFRKKQLQTGWNPLGLPRRMIARYSSYCNRLASLMPIRPPQPHGSNIEAETTQSYWPNRFEAHIKNCLMFIHEHSTQAQLMSELLSWQIPNWALTQCGKWCRPSSP